MGEDVDIKEVRNGRGGDDLEPNEITKDSLQS